MSRGPPIVVPCFFVYAGLKKQLQASRLAISRSAMSRRRTKELVLRFHVHPSRTKHRKAFHVAIRGGAMSWRKPRVVVKEKKRTARPS